MTNGMYRSVDRSAEGVIPSWWRGFWGDYCWKWFSEGGPEKGRVEKNAYLFHVRKISMSNAPVSLFKSFDPAGVSMCATRYGGRFFCDG